ncbi:odorant receptor 10a-like [Armigeres subalbatus]|uniref:odorant receptor 10a-like n=1 Tax=Armigeres subalbatus TaxID=124917 RepID=UPI002ED03CD1
MPRFDFSNGAVQYQPLQLQKRVLRLIGYYPGDDRLAHWALIFVLLFHYGSQIFLTYLEGRQSYINLKGGDLQQALEVICVAPSRFGGVIKCFILYWKRKELKQLLDILEGLFERKNPREKKINRWATYWGYQFTYWELMFTNLTCVFYCVLPIVLMIWHFVDKPDEPRIFLLPFKVGLLFNYQKSVLFEITYATMIYIAFVPIFMMAGSDGLFIGACLMVSSQYSIVRQELEDLSESLKANHNAEITPEENERVCAKLELIAQRHNQAIDITNEMSRVFRLNVFASITISALKIGLSCITMMKADQFNKLIYVWYSLGITTEIYLYSYGGTHLNEESEKLSGAAYDFPWYNYRKNVRNIIQMMMIRAQTPSRVDVPFFDVSVVTFSTILRTAGSYVTMMKSFM